MLTVFAAKAENAQMGCYFTYDPATAPYRMFFNTMTMADPGEAREAKGAWRLRYEVLGCFDGTLWIAKMEQRD